MCIIASGSIVDGFIVDKHKEQVLPTAEIITESVTMTNNRVYREAHNGSPQLLMFSHFCVMHGI